MKRNRLMIPNRLIIPQVDGIAADDDNSVGGSVLSWDSVRIKKEKLEADLRLKRERMNRKEGMSTVYMLVALTIAMGIVFIQMSSASQEQLERRTSQFSYSPGGDVTRRASDDDVSDEDKIDQLEKSISSVLSFDIGQRMREWLAKKQLADGFFFTPLSDEDDSLAREYTAQNIIATLPHFTRELVLVLYQSTSDEFIVLLPGRADRPPPKCENGCVRIENVMKAMLYAFRNRYPHKFQKDPMATNGEKDVLFLVSTGDSPRLSRECLARPGACGRRKTFAPILHFGSGFSDPTMLPSLITMPPAPRIHLRCMAEWQISHEVCEYLLPKRTLKDGRETQGLVFGEHVNYNVKGAKRKDQKEDGIVWEDLIPQVVWRGTDFSYLTLLNPDMRAPSYETDVEPKLKEYGRGVGGILRALNDVNDILKPRWKAVLLTAQAEFEANAKNNNPKRKSKKKVLPWCDMKFSAVVEHEHIKTSDLSTNEFYQKWNSIGIPAYGNELSSLELAKYKYHIDIGGGGGTTWTGTIQKMAMPGLLFHHAGAAQDWYHEHLVPWVHYIPVKEDLSDLKEQFEWAEQNDRKARAIAKAGTEFVRRMGRPEGLDELYRRHFLKPLEDVINAYKPMEEMPKELMGGGEDGLIFKEIMRCSGYDTDECKLFRD